MRQHFSQLTSRQKQSGQIALIVLLLMAVLLVMGLSLATRTTQEVFLSQQSSETARVWNAAESGAEEALNQIATGEEVPTPEAPVTFGRTINNSNVDVEISGDDQLETTITEMGVAEVQLGGSGQLWLDWGRDADCNNRADLIVSIYYQSPTDPVMRVRHETYGVDCASRGNNFDQYGDRSGNGDYNHGTSVSTNVGDQFMRIKPVYAGTAVRVTHRSGAELPTQQYEVRSTANNQLGNEERTVQVVRSLPIAPAILDYGVYSGGTISKP